MISRPTFGFDSRYRLNHRLEFERFFERSDVFRLGECVVFRIPNARNHFRLGMTLKARCTSVERMKVKRVIREFFRQSGANIAGYDFNVVIPHSKRLEHPYPARLREVLRRASETFGRPIHP